MAISGETAIVGASNSDERGTDSGSAYLFERVQGDEVWQWKAKQTASDGAAGDLFGSSVAISGGTAIVGAPYSDKKGTDSGSAYVFEKNNSGQWSQMLLTTTATTATLDFDAQPLGAYTYLEEDGFTLDYIGFGDYQAVSEAGGNLVLVDAYPDNV